MIPGSAFNEHRIAVIRRSIESSLVTAIANYNQHSTVNYEFVLPIMKENDWDKIVNNISMVTFLQGLPVKNKYYNNYCVITNNKNKEVVSDNALYVVTSDNEYHHIGCKDLVNNHQNKIINAYRNIDFQRKNVRLSDENIYFFYPQSSHAAYDCVVNVSDNYEIADIVKGRFDEKDWGENTIKPHNPTTLKRIREIYLTAIARERYDLYKTNGYFGS